MKQEKRRQTGAVTAWLVVETVVVFAVTVTAVLISLHLFDICHIWQAKGLGGFLGRVLAYRKALLGALAAACAVLIVSVAAHLRVKVVWTITLAGRARIRLPFTALWHLCLCVYLCAALFVSVRSVRRYQVDHEEVLSVRQIIAGEQRIIHACGGIEDEDGLLHTYTNSAEALAQTVSRGACVIELDLKMTADGHLVCVHGSKLEDAAGNTVEAVGEITLEEFQTCTVDGYLTPLTFAEVLDCMREHPEIYLVLDIKTGNDSAMSVIAQQMGDMIDRAIAQIYHMETYDTVRNLGFRNIILTLYRAREDELLPSALRAFAQAKELVGFTFKTKYLEDEEMMAAFRESGVALYVHTIDDPDEQERLFALGIDAVYTNIVPEKEENVS